MLFRNSSVLFSKKNLGSLRKSTLASVIGIRNTTKAELISASLKNTDWTNVNAKAISANFPLAEGTMTAAAWRTYLASEVVSVNALSAEMEVRMVSDMVPFKRFELSSKVSDTPYNWAARVVSSMQKTELISRNTTNKYAPLTKKATKRPRHRRVTSRKTRNFDGKLPLFTHPTTLDRKFRPYVRGTSGYAPYVYRVHSAVNKYKETLYGNYQFFLGAIESLEVQHQSTTVPHNASAMVSPLLAVQSLMRSEGICNFETVSAVDFEELEEKKHKRLRNARRVLFASLPKFIKVAKSYNRMGVGNIRLGAPHMSHFGNHLKARRSGLDGYGQPVGISATAPRMIAALTRARLFNLFYPNKFGYPQGYIRSKRPINENIIFRDERQVMAMLTWDPAIKNTLAKRYGIANSTSRDFAHTIKSLVSFNRIKASRRMRRGLRKVRAVVRRKRWQFRRSRSLAWTHGYSAGRRTQNWWNRRMRFGGKRGSAPGYLLFNQNSYHRSRRSRIHYFRDQPYFKRRWRNYVRREERRSGFSDEVYRKQSRVRKFYGFNTGAFMACAVSMHMKPNSTDASRRYLSRKLRNSLYDYRSRRMRRGKLVGGRGNTKYRLLRKIVSTARRNYTKKRRSRLFRARTYEVVAGKNPSRVTQELRDKARTRKVISVSALTTPKIKPSALKAARIFGMQYASQGNENTFVEFSKTRQKAFMPMVRRQPKKAMRLVHSILAAREAAKVKEGELEAAEDAKAAKKDKDETRVLYHSASQSLNKLARVRRKASRFGTVRHAWGNVLVGTAAGVVPTSSLRLASLRVSTDVDTGLKTLVSPTPMQTNTISGFTTSTYHGRNSSSQLKLKKPVKKTAYDIKKYNFTKKFPRAHAFGRFAIYNKAKIKQSRAIAGVMRSAELLDSVLLAINNPKRLSQMDIFHASSLVVHYTSPSANKLGAIKYKGVKDLTGPFTFARQKDQRLSTAGTGTCYMPLIMLEETVVR